MHERPRDGDPLAFTAGQFARVVGHPVGEPDPFERLGGQHAAILRPHPEVDETVGNVLEGRRACEEEKPLEHEPDPAPSDRCEAAIRETRRVDPFDQNPTRGRPVERAHHVQHRRLAASGRADHTGHLAAVDPQ